jgi:hypothetical protein
MKAKNTLQLNQIEAPSQVALCWFQYVRKLKEKVHKIVYSFSSDPEGALKNCQRVLKFLSQIFGSDTSKRVDNFPIDPLASKNPSRL